MYLNLAQLAESFGVSERVVEGWIRDEGLPQTQDGGRLLFDRVQVARWAVAHGLAAHAGFLAPETPAFATGGRLEPLLRAGGIWRDVPDVAVWDVFDRVVASLPAATPPIRQFIGERLRATGGLAIAPLDGGLALSHPTAPVTLGRGSGALALLFLRDGFSGISIQRLFFFIAPSPRAHLDSLGRLGRLLTRGPLRERVVSSASDDELFEAVAMADATSPRPNGSKG